VDSVPAVLAVSNDAFIVYTSNAFAILGLRALYFMLAGLLDRFHYLSKGLALILAFIGVKLVLQASHKTINNDIPEIPSLVSLAVIVAVLAASVVLSLRRPVQPPPVAPPRQAEKQVAAPSPADEPVANDMRSEPDKTRRTGDPPEPER
jgi:tellurite resistance protein TerC